MSPAGVEPLDPAPPLLDPGGIPWIPRHDRNRGEELRGREKGLPFHVDMRDPHPGALHDRDHDVRACPVVVEPDLGGADGRVGESLGPGEGLERRHVPVEDVLAEQPLLQDARGARRDRRLQLLGREGDVAGERHRRDAHLRPLGHHEADRRGRGAVEVP
jgi:hypothetical protein